MKRSRLAVWHRDADNLVALLEIISPSDKRGQFALRTFVSNAVDYLDAGIQLQILDLFPPGPLDPQGIHSAVWSAMVDHDFRLPPDKPLTLAAYTGGAVREAYIDPVAVGDSLPDMPLFMEPARYVSVPLEATYQTAFDAVPRRWREVLEAPPA